MNTSPAELHILRRGAYEDIAHCHFDKLELTPAGLSGPSPFEALDFFDQPLRNSGRLLVTTGGQLVLVSAGGGLLQQAAGRTGEFLSAFPDGPVARALGDLSELRRFLPLGGGVLRLSEFALTDNEGKTRARLYALQFEREDGVGGVDIAIVAGLRGYEKSARLVSDALIGLGDGKTTGMDAVYASLFPDMAAYSAKPKIAMEDTEATFDIANDIIAAYLAVAGRNEAGIIADLDTEFLHDYRIALRKIRSVVSLFKGIYSEVETQRLKMEFSNLMAPTGRLRDLDVYLIDRQRYFDLLPSSLHEGLTVMFDMFEKERAATHRALVRWLEGRQYRSTMTALATTFTDPVAIAEGANARRQAHGYARVLIWKRYRKVCRIAAGIGADTGDEEVHELRIDCKKLRYLMELFAPLFPARRLKGLVRPMKELQDNLGLFNDYSVQQETLEQFLAGLAPQNRKTNIKVAQSIGALITILNQRQRAERGRIVASFAHFNSAAVQKEFSDIFRTKGSSG